NPCRRARSSSSIFSSADSQMLICSLRRDDTGGGGVCPASSMVATAVATASRVLRTQSSAVLPSTNAVGSSRAVPTKPTPSVGSRMSRYRAAISRARAQTSLANGRSIGALLTGLLDDLVDLFGIDGFHAVVMNGNRDF